MRVTVLDPKGVGVVSVEKGYTYILLTSPSRYKSKTVLITLHKIGRPIITPAPYLARLTHCITLHRPMGMISLHVVLPGALADRLMSAYPPPGSDRG